MSSNKNPLISIVMSVFNAEAHVAEAIESILNQTYSDFEFLIIDDASTDNSFDILSSFRDERITLIQNKENLGLTKSLNKGIKLAKGQYIARMDADDISLPSRLAKQLQFMQEHPEIDICGTWYKTFGEKEYLQKLPALHEQIKADLLFYTPIAHPSVLMKKNIFEAHKYPENFQKAQDYALWIKLIKNYKFANLPEPLLKYRIHKNQISTKQNTRQKEFALNALSDYYQIIGFNTSPKFLKISTYLFLGHILPLSDTESWMKQLIDLNARTHFFEEHSLEKSLFSIWKAQVFAQTSYDMKTWIKFYTSPVYMPKQLTILMHLKFIFKCIIKHKNNILDTSYA